MSDEPQTPEPDLVDRLLAKFDYLLDLVHDRVLRPIIIGARFLAFGIILIIVVSVLASVLVIGFIRLLNIYAFGGRDWISCVAVGGASFITGLVIWRRRKPAKLRK